MEWVELSIELNAKDLDTATAIANMAVPYGFYVEDYRTLEQETWEIANIDLIDEELLNKDRTKGIIHIYIAPSENPNEAVSFLTEQLSREGIEHNIVKSVCKNEDWENNWKEFFKPLKIGNKILIRPLWIDDYENDDNRKVLSIEPGLAFGTGTHNTTRLCIETLERYVTKNSTVLDTGCGSGILGISALLMGAKSSVGVDIDELAVKTAIENGRQNGFCEPQYKILEGNLTDKVSGKFDIIVANIVADIIMLFTKDVGQFMNDDAVFITSGIISMREDEVVNSFAKNGFEIIERNADEDWLCFVCKKKKD
ncbi:MAG: 50S ribosomal protein L11 methyltransferase [Oscillospiraceae bacterium]